MSPRHLPYTPVRPHVSRCGSFPWSRSASPLRLRYRHRGLRGHFLSACSSGNIRPWYTDISHHPDGLSENHKWSEMPPSHNNHRHLWPQRDRLQPTGRKAPHVLSPRVFPFLPVQYSLPEDYEGPEKHTLPASFLPLCPRHILWTRPHFPF